MRSPVTIVAYLPPAPCRASTLYGRWPRGELGGAVCAHFPDLGLSISAVADNAAEERKMGKIIVSENVTLDGVIQDPTGDEGFRLGGWLGRIGDRGRAEAAKVALDEALDTEAMLLGRRSYEFLAARWPGRSGALADRLNNKPKYVVSATLEDPDWHNTTVLRGDVVDAVSQLKRKLAGAISVAASFQLVRTLIEHDLVDVLRLMVYPVVLGAGERLFGASSGTLPLRLIGTRTVDDLAYLIYQPARDA
jgi:dihydrofolate reductase